MIYTIKDTKIYVKASKPILALKKIIRKIVLKHKQAGVNIYEIKDEITLVDGNAKEFYYIFKVIEKEQNEQISIYFDFDYNIQIYKLLTVK